MTLDDIWQSLREGFFMFWQTLWPLILGFTLSGAVQAFAPREQMERVMGDHRPRSVARASGLGMVSSSCSYAATAMGKSLFQKGADFVTAMIFMFASTNLVIELGIVLIVLMGWQFAAAEFVGGPIMIILLALTGSWVIKAKLAERARRRLESGMVDGHDHDAMVGVSHERQEQLEHTEWSVKLRSRGAWADAASYSIADLTMLRRELVLGYGIAGFLTVMVSTDTWNSIFLQGHGFWTTLENVIVGPFIAIISFVCSIGNIPMAAALWHGGISFGGVIAFIFGDLITVPLLLIYRKYYGGRLTLRLLFWFWAVMSTAGLITEVLFDAAGLHPHQPHPDRRRHQLPVELHHLPQHHLLSPRRVSLLAVPQPGTPRRRRRLRHRPGLWHADPDRERARPPHPQWRRVLVLLRPLRHTIRHRSRTSLARTRNRQLTRRNPRPAPHLQRTLSTQSSTIDPTIGCERASCRFALRSLKCAIEHPGAGPALLAEMRFEGAGARHRSASASCGCTAVGRCCDACAPSQRNHASAARNTPIDTHALMRRPATWCAGSMRRFSNQKRPNV